MRIQSSGADKPLSMEDFDMSSLRKVEERTVPKTATPNAHKMRIQPQGDEAIPPQKVSTLQTSESAVDSGSATPPVFDSAYQSEGLPSAFVFYPFKTLQMRTLLPRDQLLIFRGRQANKMSFTIDAISATIRQNASDLTPGDFWYLMYKQRLNSYKKTPFTVTWTCVSDAHLEAIENAKSAVNQLWSESIDEKKVDRNRLAELEAEVARLEKAQSQVTTLGNSHLEIEELDPERVAKIQAKRAEMLEQGVELAPVTMRKLSEMMDEMENIPVEDREYIDFYNRYAGCLSDAHGKTMAEKRAFIENSELSDLLNDIDEFIALASHGVTEFFNCKCTECGTIDKVKQTIDVPQFFPRYL